MTSFWKAKNVLISGGYGFVGTHFAKKLEELGANPIRPTKKDYDLRDGQKVKQLFLDFPNVDIVVHLAANEGGIGANLEHPGEFFYDNIMIGTQLMHEAYKAGIKKFVAAGTVCSYPKVLPAPFKEEDIWNGYPEETNAFYGLAKKMLIVQSLGYRQQYDFNSVVLLPVNLYGPGDNFNLENSHVIPAIIRKCYEAKQNGATEIPMWGDGSATREFLYIDDFIEGLLLASEKYDSSDPLNIGSGFEISIKDLAEFVAKKIGYTGTFSWDKTHPNGQPRRILDSTKAKQILGYQAETTFDKGIENTIDYYVNVVRSAN